MCDEKEPTRAQRGERDIVIINRAIDAISEYYSINLSNISPYARKELEFKLRVSVKQAMDALLNNLPV